ncbi:hypothetical protein A1O3_09166 [Capronia epimyces CBS 606.96]|uniref:Heterokaryon incompatibility domain-containing protein n=1 Tax=Capronia epimyces CBS 606.96 TaxID=1182542 RepID=W9XBZ9_9EURO|nr:uncharacterized protein A1O3_09166 [Capronia epimyces CBS 606.96]EXJ78007.1 hypothetical protein A1O3_09166 [Capronia epimyces CBS 606.96]
MQRDNADFMILHPVALSLAGASVTSGRTVDKSQIHLPVLKAWISECVASHGVTCNGFHLPNADGKLRSLRLVDVITSCVVRQPSSSRYVALSYVWGEASSLQLTRENEDHLRSPGALGSHISEIPQTFLDAFEVVKSIGERYIWIDALCITQDAEDKEAHLQDMHLVYGAALFTLVAGGDDANVGLPGVRPWTRSRAQLYERLRPEIGIAVSMPLPADLKTSRWSLRAWTYQEQLLSKRFLVFFDDQVLWQCPTVVECEDTLAENKSAPYERLKHLSSLGLNEDEGEGEGGPIKRAIESGFQRLPAFQRYADIVSEYTGRELSFPEDVLRAFGGISKIFMLDLNTDMVEGLPVSFLDAAILWQPSAPLRRRSGNERFASWAWAGWEGKVSYEETKGRHGAEGLLPIIKWNVHRTELVNRYGVGIKPYLFSPGIESTSWVSPFEPPATAGAGAGATPTQTSAQLKFWTSCSFFDRLVKRSHIHGHGHGTREVDTDQISDHDLGRLRPQEYQIRNARGQPVGVVTITGEDLPLQRYSSSRYEYIVLSEAQFAGIDLVAWLPIFSDQPGKCLMYNVMLIEWDQDMHCAYRVGLGRILKTAWAQSGPRNKYITLG